MTEFQMLSAIKNFPFGEIANDRKGMLSKAEVVTYLSKYQDQFKAMKDYNDIDNSMAAIEAAVGKFLGEVVGLKEGETLPSIEEAKMTLHIRPDTLENYGVVQATMERNPLANELYDEIAKGIGLEVTKGQK